MSNQDSLYFCAEKRASLSLLLSAALIPDDVFPLSPIASPMEFQNEWAVELRMTIRRATSSDDIRTNEFGASPEADQLTELI